MRSRFACVGLLFALRRGSRTGLSDPLPLGGDGHQLLSLSCSGGVPIGEQKYCASGRLSSGR